MQKFDIIIIGAGIAGASTAALISKDKKVLMLDMEKAPGYHSTGRSAAYYSSAYGNETVKGITQAGYGFFKQPPTEFTQVPLFKPRSELTIATKAQLPALQARLAANPFLTSLDQQQTMQQVEILDANKIVAATLDETGGDLDVDALLQAYLKQFLNNGGQLQVDARVEKITHHQDHFTIETQHQSYQATTVVNAAGAWADDVAQLLGLAPLGLQPMRRTALLVDAPLNIACSHWPLTVDVNEQFYFKPDAGAILISPAEETPMSACDAYPDEFDIATAVDRVQTVSNLQVKKVNHSWAGLRTFSPDRNFVVGFDPRQSGFFWLAGQGGYGVQAAPGLSTIAAHLLGCKTELMSEADILTFAKVINPRRLL